MPSRLSQEVAAASRVLTSELGTPIYQKPTRSNLLIDTAKRLQRLQTKASKLKKDLKRTVGEVKAAKRLLKSLAQEIGKGE